MQNLTQREILKKVTNDWQRIREISLLIFDEKYKEGFEIECRFLNDACRAAVPVSVRKHSLLADIDNRVMKAVTRLREKNLVKIISNPTRVRK